MNDVTIISSGKNWLEESAVSQLKKLCTLPGVVKAVGLPDLHPGKTPVGSVIITEGMIYPHLIGSDIGCGMSMFKADLEKRKLNIDRLVKRAESIKSLREIELPEAEGCPLGESLGTIGGGNHFAELQETQSVYDEETFKNLGFDQKQLSLLIHSGSRGYGQTILDESIKVYSEQNGLSEASDAAKYYLAKHDDAIKWALTNRELIAYRLLKALGLSTKVSKLLDSCHNSIDIRESGSKPLYIHRKGAAPGDKGAVVIPGSRGSLTYLVIPSGNTMVSGYSLAHGAGRKWERSVCRPRLENKYTKESIKSTRLKGRVICGDSGLLFEEAPEAYKNIDTVIQSLSDFGLINVIATFKPVLTYKN